MEYSNQKQFDGLVKGLDKDFADAGFNEKKREILIKTLILNIAFADDVHRELEGKIEELGKAVDLLEKRLNLFREHDLREVSK